MISAFFNPKAFKKAHCAERPYGKATASDIEKLINKVKEEVKVKTGVNLELEIKIVGNEK